MRSLILPNWNWRELVVAYVSVVVCEQKLLTDGCEALLSHLVEVFEDLLHTCALVDYVDYCDPLVARDDIGSPTKRVVWRSVSLGHSFVE